MLGIDTPQRMMIEGFSFSRGPESVVFGSVPCYGDRCSELSGKSKSVDGGFQNVGNLLWWWETSLKSRGILWQICTMCSLKMRLISFVGNGTHTHIVFLIRLAEFFLHLSGCPHHVLHRHSHSSNRCSGL